VIEVQRRLGVEAILAHMEVGCRRQGSHQQGAAVWLMLWQPPLRRGTRRLLIVVSCHLQKTRRGRHTNKPKDDEDDDNDWD
jgi:hypothetical protein